MPKLSVRSRASTASLAQTRFSWLDFKVGVRILARYPGLTLVGTVAIAVAITLGTLYFEAVNKWQHPTEALRRKADATTHVHACVVARASECGPSSSVSTTPLRPTPGRPG